MLHFGSHQQLWRVVVNAARTLPMVHNQSISRRVSVDVMLGDSQCMLLGICEMVDVMAYRDDVVMDQDGSFVLL